MRLCVAVVAEPLRHFVGVGVRWEDRVEDVLDGGATQYKGQAPVQRLAVGLERGKLQRVRECEPGVGEHRVGQMQAICERLLVVGPVRGQGEDSIDAFAS